MITSSLCRHPLADLLLPLVDIGPGTRLLLCLPDAPGFVRAIRPLEGVSLYSIDPDAAVQKDLSRLNCRNVANSLLNFIGFEYDSICLVTPADMLLAIEYSRHACVHLLAPGGKLVAVIPEEPFTSDHRQADAFRSYLYDKASVHTEALPAMASEITGYSGKARIVVFQKPPAEKDSKSCEMWELTLEELGCPECRHDARILSREHRQAVYMALKHNKPVPAAVRRQYPTLSGINIGYGPTQLTFGYLNRPVPPGCLVEPGHQG